MPIHSISILGTGYVGLTTAVGFASKGYKVIISTHEKQKVNSINEGIPPFYEHGLTELLQKVVKKGDLRCVLQCEEVILSTNSTFIATGTPSQPDGSIDLQYIKNSSCEIGEVLKKKDKYHLVVVKSTVVPGTTNNVVKPIIEEHSGKRCGVDFGLCMNPEFLAEGSALKDTFSPDRIVIGEYNRKSGDLLESLYKDFYRGNIPPIIRTNLQNAELVKYTSNAFLAMKISFINQIANLCQRIPNADVNVIARSIGLDKRIGPLFLKAGLGWGGSCFLKDLMAILNFSKSTGAALPLTEATLSVNQAQPLKAVKLAEKLLGDLEGKSIAILGLSFKPGTDDMRDAVSIKIVEELLRRNARIAVYDPAAMENARKILGDKLQYCKSALECICGVDCAIVVTEWPEFSKLKPEDFTSRMRNPILVDGRRIYNPEKFSPKLTYMAIGFGSQNIQLEPDETTWVNPALAVNVIVEDKRKILLVKRRLEPFKGLWSLPGGYVEYGETAENAAKRELKEECGIDVQLLRIIGVFSSPERHPWKHVIAICYTAKKVGGQVKAGANEENANFFKINCIPEKLAFDHAKMMKDYINGCADQKQ
jgi:UDPglucose 6-dehydrogenase